MNIETVNELIQSLESAGELSIKETKVMALAKAYQQLAAENVAQQNIIGAIQEVYYKSEGVVGYHLNGDIAKWEDVMPDLWAKTPATDRIYAEAEARGVEKFIASLPSYADTEVDTYDDGVKAAIETTQTVYGPVFIKQLREGVDK